MRNVICYLVFAEDQLKLSTIDEEEASQYKLILDLNGVECELLSMEITPIDHTKK